MREMLGVTARARRRGARRRGGADHRRPLLGRDARPDGRPRRAGGAAAARSPRCATATSSTIDVETRDARTSSVATTSSTGACSSGARPSRATRRACFAKYAALVSSASEGAVTRRDARACVEQLPDRARRLADALLVLDEREAHVPVAALAEADARADGDVGLARELAARTRGSRARGSARGSAPRRTSSRAAASTCQPARSSPSQSASRRLR